MNKKTSLLFIAGAGLAAYAIYRYKKLSAEDKAEIKDTLKTHGMEFVNNLVPENVRSKFTNAAASAAESAGKFSKGI